MSLVVGTKAVQARGEELTSPKEEQGSTKKIVAKL
jgi:hypothetical protein